MPRCYPGTQTLLLDDIMRWTNCPLAVAARSLDDTPSDRLMWLSGTVGTGKSTILRSVGDICESEGRLAATFSFSPFGTSMTHRATERFIPTLAYQLCQHQQLGALKEFILRAIADDPAIFKRRLADQMECLILKPLRTLQAVLQGQGDATDASESEPPGIILIDGIDEQGASTIRRRVE